MVKKYVDMEDSVLLTDEFKGYNRFDAIMEHVKIDHNKMYSYRGLNTNTIESFFAIIKRGIMGQYHSISDEYLPKYLDEFMFKYNNRIHDDMFETLVFNSMLPDKKTFRRYNKELKDKNIERIEKLKKGNKK
jgi:hypothetical protein